jgi:D-glycero-D-manno-heptose 1,7-bisphosphate phosphatase
MTTQQSRCILLDRDGVINRRIPDGYITSWDQFDFLPGALAGLRLLARHNFTTLVLSNQACVAKGLLSSHELDILTRRFLLEVALAGGHISRVYYCRHADRDGCNCRKPLPGLINQAQSDFQFYAADTFFVGDSDSDLRAAAAAGCPSIFIKRGAFLNPSAVSSTAEMTASSLLEAAEAVLALSVGNNRAATLAPVQA